MTRQEWLEQAVRFEQRAAEAYRRGDEIAGEMYENKAAASRFCADFAPEDSVVSDNGS